MIQIIKFRNEIFLSIIAVHQTLKQFAIRDFVEVFNLTILKLFHSLYMLILSPINQTIMDYHYNPELIKKFSDSTTRFKIFLAILVNTSFED